MIIHHIPSIHERRTKQVAAYCRVSTDRADQEGSFETQVSYYTNLITNHPGWELVRIYADEGKSATSTQHRPEFMQMIDDALDGKIDIILTKSISRFARNVVDCRTYVEKLRTKGVEIRFERENISSQSASTDMIFSMMAAVAQDESRSISENVKWGCQKRFAQGIHHIGSNSVLGYDEVDGVLQPNESAWVIRMIFQQFLEDIPYAKIAENITAAGAKRLRGKTPLNGKSVMTILNNEIYVGDRNFQKNPPRNYLTKKPDLNAQYQSWYWRDVHEGIIDRETWERAQAKLERRRRETLMGVQRKGKETHFLYGVAFCGLCGAPLIRRTVPCRSIKKLRGADGGFEPDAFTEDMPRYCKSWNCRNHFNDRRCPNKFIKEDILLEKVAERLGWESADAELIETEIARIEVKDGEVNVIRKVRRVIA